MHKALGMEYVLGSQAWNWSSEPQELVLQIALSWYPKRDLFHSMKNIEGLNRTGLIYRIMNPRADLIMPVRFCWMLDFDIRPILARSWALILNDDILADWLRDSVLKIYEVDSPLSKWSSQRNHVCDKSNSASPSSSRGPLQYKSRACSSICQPPTVYTKR